MPRPDFRKLAADRLGTPEPMSGRIAALLGIDERLLDTLLPVTHAPVSTPVRPTSRSGATPLFALPLDVVSDAPAKKGIRPAPRSRSFSIPASMLQASAPSLISVAPAPVAAPAPAPSTRSTGRKRPSRRPQAASPVLSVASAPVVAPASAPSRTGAERKRPSRRKSLMATTAARGPVIETRLSDRERRAIAAAILGTNPVAAAPAVTAAAAPRRVKRPRRVTRPAVAAAPEATQAAAPVAAPVVAAISIPTPTVTSTRPAVAETGTPAVTGPSPVGDLRGDVASVLTPAPVSRPVLVEPTETTQLLLGDASSGKREAAQAAFSDALSHLVTTLSAADGRPESELERARLRKFLQISRIYLDNLAVTLKD